MTLDEQWHHRSKISFLVCQKYYWSEKKQKKIYLIKGFILFWKFILLYLKQVYVKQKKKKKIIEYVISHRDCLDKKY